MDLTGPKLRTGSINPRTQVVKWRPQRDLRGDVTRAAEVWLTPTENPEPAPSGVGGCLHIPPALLVRMHKGDSIKFKDLRGKSRVLEVGSAHGQCHIALCTQTIYLSTADLLPFTHNSKAKGATTLSSEARVAPPAQSFIVLKPGDTRFGGE